MSGNTEFTIDCTPLKNKKDRPDLGKLGLARKKAGTETKMKLELNDGKSRSRHQQGDGVGMNGSR